MACFHSSGVLHTNSNTEDMAATLKSENDCVARGSKAVFAASRAAVRVKSERPALHRPRCLTNSGLEFHLAAHVPRSSCTSPRRHGRLTHQPEDALYGGSGPDLPCYPVCHFQPLNQIITGIVVSLNMSCVLGRIEAKLTNILSFCIVFFAFFALRRLVNDHEFGDCQCFLAHCTTPHCVHLLQCFKFWYWSNPFVGSSLFGDVFISFCPFEIEPFLTLTSNNKWFPLLICQNFD